ncbi:MAG: type II toxin-antitoxin system prevent-host-death family antitoxin [Acidobacteriota bacterium]
MPIIKPISDLRNKSKRISRLAHEANEPIFITKNGEGDLVVMSLARFGEMQRKLELYRKLAVAQGQKARGDRGKKLADVVRDLRKKLREQA